MRWPHHRYALVLAGLYALLFAVTAIAPRDRQTWLLENAVALVCVAALVLISRRLPLSRISYTLIFVFLCLHTVGAHYTYSEVPYDEWMEALTGRTVSDLLGWERNHFDRFVHFCYGLLLAYPVRELFMRVAEARGFWSYFLPLEMVMSTSLLYELVEWAAAEVFGGEMGIHYLGTQGDEWDAQKDMALATLGAVIAMTTVALVNMRLQRDFAREWSASLSIKRKRPLGEDRLREHLSGSEDDDGGR
ncbi:MAG: DUF2238 domain-containing protein [Planctomycetota bacterium]|jgi:putative membrane protein